MRCCLLEPQPFIRVVFSQTSYSSHCAIEGEMFALFVPPFRNLTNAHCRFRPAISVVAAPSAGLQLVQREGTETQTR